MREQCTPSGCSVRFVISLFAIATMTGCQRSSPSWLEQSTSPDRSTVAEVSMSGTNGIGVGNIGTYVYLNWTAGSQEPQLILAFDDGFENTRRTIPDLRLSWKDNRHLEIAYKEPRVISFEAVVCRGVEISVHSTQ